MHIKKYILFHHIVDIYVNIGSRISAGFKTIKGLKQECGLLPTLLKIYLENVLYDGNKKCKSRGLPVGNETVRHHLGADDQDKDDAEYMTKQLIAEYQKWGLNINILKAEYLNVESDKQNTKLECNIESKGSRSFWNLGSPSL
jgi:hypothetical protein